MAEFVHPPIERHEAIAPLSRDHYVGLVHASRLIKAADRGRAERHGVLAGFLDAWDREILEHFRDEETLFTGLIGASDRERLLEEHARLGRMAEGLRAMRGRVDPDPEALAAMGVALRDHIRWEERDLFNTIQRENSPGALEDLRRETGSIDARRGRSVPGSDQQPGRSKT